MSAITKCNRDCFNCIYSDCVMDDMSVEEKQKSIEHDTEAKKDKATSYKMQYYYANQEKCKRWSRENYHRHAEAKREKSKNYYHAHKDKFREYSARWREEHKDLLKERNKVYQARYYAKKKAERLAQLDKKAN